MASFWEKAISILAGSLNSGRSYLINLRGFFIYLFILLLVLFQFTYGVNAWRHWVVGKNAELEKARSQGKYIKPFETDILKLRADELNYTLCMFVKEVKKPNGEPYASDSIFYLTLGIQVCKLLIFVQENLC